MTSPEQPFNVEHVDDLELDANALQEEIDHYALEGATERQLLEIASDTYLRELKGDPTRWLTDILWRVKRGIKRAVAHSEELGLSAPSKAVMQLLPACQISAEFVNPPWLVKGILPSEGIGIVYGPSGSAKGFLLLDMAVAIATGTEWQGCRTRMAPVFIINLEGGSSFPRRLQAIEAITEKPMPAQIFVLNNSPFQITNADRVDQLVTAILNAHPTPGLVIIDTLARASPGTDENSSEGMGEVISGAERLQQRAGGLVMLVHHVGKDANKGPRGHSSLLAALDAVIEIERSGDQRCWRLAKSKDGEDGIGGSFTLRKVALGVDSDGDPVTSCVVEHAERLATVCSRSVIPAGANQRLAYEQVKKLLLNSLQLGRGQAGPATPCVTIEEAINSCLPVLTVEPKRRRERARQAITSLIEKGLLAHHDAWLWRPENNSFYTPPSTRPVSPAPKGAAGNYGNSGAPQTRETGKTGETRSAFQQVPL